MQVALVFPPSLCLPNPIYFSLPLLAVALKEAGHGVAQVDLNVLAADRLLTREKSELILGTARDAVKRRLDDSLPEQAAELQALIEANADKLLNGEASKEILRDTEIDGRI